MILNATNQKKIHAEYSKMIKPFKRGDARKMLNPENTMG